MRTLIFILCILNISCATYYSEKLSVLKINTDNKNYRVICKRFFSKSEHYPDIEEVVWVEKNRNCFIEYFSEKDQKMKYKEINNEFNPLIISHFFYYGVIFIWFDFISGYHTVNKDQIIYLED